MSTLSSIALLAAMFLVAYVIVTEAIRRHQNSDDDET